MRTLSLLLALLLAAGLLGTIDAEEARPADSLVVVVMDPLAKPLSCPCVAGYAQRDYEKLGAALTKALGRDVKIVFN
jgi:hypothetical protein